MAQTRPFNSQHNLETLILLRKKGYTYHSLALLFNVDFSTIYHHVHTIKTKDHLVFSLPNIISYSQIDTSSILSLLNLRCRNMKTYKEYLEESKMRQKYPNSYKLFSKL